jgi:hypothetical protein
MARDGCRRQARRAAGPWVCALLSAALLLARSSVAAAYHTEDEHVTDDTAWTLKGPKNWRLGLYKASFTVADRFAVGTYIAPWVTGNPNLFAKLRFLSLGPWQWALQAGFIRVDTQFLIRGGPDAPIFTVGTLGLMNSVEFSQHHQLSTGLIGTVVRVSGRLDDDTLRGNGSAALTNMQLMMAYEWRLSRTLALIVTGRYQLLQVLAGETRFTANPDEYTSVDVVLAASDDHVVNFRNAFSVAPALAWSWEYFNLRLGVGYGNYNVPGVNFMIKQRVLFPEFDLYWTF